MSDFTYSVAIRTLGTAGEKYEKLMNSIKRQTIQPEKIVVVLPYGYEPPRYRLGNEEFVFCEKGMMPQRLSAVQYISSEYILFCDDDVEFETEFVDKLSNAFEKGYVCATGPLLDFFPSPEIKHFFASVLGGACVMLHGRRNNYVRLLSTGGWSYNYSIDLKKHKIYDTESIAGTCFMVNRQVMRNLNFEDEFWAEKNGYSAFEDRIMIGKIIINGYKVGVVSDAKYIHNDGKTSTRDLRLEPKYAAAFNHYVFWYRYLYEVSNNISEKIWKKICIYYYIVMSLIYSLILILMRRSTKEAFVTIVKGYKDAKKFVSSEEYCHLSKAIIEEEIWR